MLWKPVKSSQGCGEIAATWRLDGSVRKGMETVKWAWTNYSRTGLHILITTVMLWPSREAVVGPGKEWSFIAERTFIYAGTLVAQVCAGLRDYTEKPELNDTTEANTPGNTWACRIRVGGKMIIRRWGKVKKAHRKVLCVSFRSYLVYFFSTISHLWRVEMFWVRWGILWWLP